MRKAFLYLRFSSPEQAKGNSYERQLEKARVYCDENNFLLQEDRYEDLGVSAFRGDNRNKDLGKLIDAIESGVITSDDVILVESLDRLSRETVTIAMHNFLKLLGLGVDLVTIIDRQLHSTSAINEEPFKLMMSLSSIIRANEESEVKSKRIGSAWNEKQQLAKESNVIKTKRIPAWLKINEENKFEIIEEKALIVRHIFQLSSSGIGRRKICQMLNDEKVPTLVTEGGRVPKRWYESTLAKLLSFEAVIGYFIPTKNDSERKRVPDIENRVKGYYPIIVDEAIYQRVQALRSSRARVSGRKGKAMSNIIQGLAFCSVCNGRMQYLNKNSRDVYLKCFNQVGSTFCSESATWRYQIIEKTIVHLFTKIRIKDFIQKVDDGLENLIASKEIELLAKKQGLNKLAEEFGGDDNLKPAIEKSSSEVTFLTEEIGLLKSKKVQDKTLSDDVVDLKYQIKINSMLGDMETRVKINTTCKRLGWKFIFHVNNKDQEQRLITLRLGGGEFEIFTRDQKKYTVILKFSDELNVRHKMFTMEAINLRGGVGQVLYREEDYFNLIP